MPVKQCNSLDAERTVDLITRGILTGGNNECFVCLF